MKARTLDSASFSTWDKTEKCPARTAYQKIDRLSDPAGPAAERGQLVHSAMERYGKNEAALPSNLLRWRPALDALRAGAPGAFFPELELALTRAWRATTWGRAKIRAKLDLVVLPGKEATVVDFKTGNEYPEHVEQLDLYATLVLHLHKKVVKVTGQDWYLDLGHPREHVFHRDEHAQRLVKWRERFEALLLRTEWPARRNPGCKWCPYNVRKGGPCKEGA